MPAYLIANVEIKDFEKIKDYMAATPAALKKYSGRFLIRGGAIAVMEGNWEPKRLVVVEFDTLEKAQEFYHSKDYEPLIALRKAAAHTDLILVDGISPEMALLIKQNS